MAPEPGGRGLPMRLYVGDVLELKKPHACGANEWEVVRLGMDIRLRCRGCDRGVMLARSRLERRLRRFLRRPAAATPGSGEELRE